MIISEANMNDLYEILSLQKTCYLSEAEIYDDYNIQPLLQSIAEITEEYKYKKILKIEINDKIIGSVRAYEKDKICYISKLIVHPEYQNIGIGSKLLREIEKRFKDAERFELFTGHKSEKNLYLYQKLGYKIFKEEIKNEKMKYIYLYKLNKTSLDLKINFAEIKDNNDYKKICDSISKIQIKMVEKNGECKHNLGDTFIYENPCKRPDGVCCDLLHVIDWYIWRVAFGFPSWNEDDRRKFLIHCPDKKGTIWEIEKID